ncbi:Uncharacterised protein [uncultured archaeon]|nr:Uncharacterised protein [uncultured archaeon]
MASPSKTSAPASAKDPAIAALISVVGLLILGAPALGYIYMGQMKKGLIYLLGTWVLSAVFIAIGFIIGLATMGIGFLCLPLLLLLLLALDIAIVWDVYKTSKGEKGILPNF